jgi:hypothetical protein|tara:strand:+ start:507 stop:1610 length:1104 start_codon:yes stop_codon:yes gene_type:complete
MSTTYLTLANNVLQELNEVALTSTTFSSSRGIQTSVKNFVNKSVHDIYNEAGEIPALHTTASTTTTAGTQEYSFESDMRKVDFESFFLQPKELITNGEFTSNINSWTTIAGAGSAAYTSTGNGRLRLNDYAAYQAITTTVNKTYKLQLRVFDTNSVGQALKVQVGTAAEGTQNLNTTVTVSDFGAGKILETKFTATAQTSYITVNNTTTSTNLDIDYIRISRDDVATKKLNFISYDHWLQSLKERDSKNDEGVHAVPDFVYRKPNYSSFGLSPVPDSDDYNIEYDYYQTHTELSAHGDTMSLPDRFRPLIVDRAKYYTYMLRSDPAHAQLAERDYQRKLRLLRVDYASRQEYMKDSRITNGSRVHVI